MTASITWQEKAGPRSIEAGETLIGQLFTLLAVASTKKARARPERAAAAWFAWHDVAVYGREVDHITLEEIPWEGEPDDKRAFLLRTVDTLLEGRWWSALFEVAPDVPRLQELLRRLRAAIHAFDPTVPSTESAEEPRRYGRCLLHAVPLHRYGCIVCNHDELYGALSGTQCQLAGRLLSSEDAAERSEAARLLAAEAVHEPSRLTLCALAHVLSLAVEREQPGLLRTYLLSTLGVCARQAGDALDLRHVAPLAGLLSVLDGWDAAQAHSVLDAIEREEPAASLGDA
ncbi:MAG TPA: hypothetical protein VH134_14960 [Candidatus Dormibacteraeota bacterium]|jgi:hypothetical protein|nr:hypothetical protein [Candidatus Dormibacteraeota bacterium]